MDGKIILKSVEYFIEYQSVHNPEHWLSCEKYGAPEIARGRVAIFEKLDASRVFRIRKIETISREAIL